MANGSRITIRVLRAQGHGVHGMLPHEQAWVELWIEDPKTRTVATQKRKGYPLVWDEEFVFDIGQTERGENQNAVEVHVYAKVRGEMATSGHDDIGVGEINVKKVRHLSMVRESIDVRINT